MKFWVKYENVGFEGAYMRRVELDVFDKLQRWLTRLSVQDFARAVAFSSGIDVEKIVILEVAEAHDASYVWKPITPQPTWERV